MHISKLTFVGGKLTQLQLTQYETDIVRALLSVANHADAIKRNGAQIKTKYPWISAIDLMQISSKIYAGLGRVAE